MKLKLILLAFLFGIFHHLKAQTIIGEGNPCPDRVYEYVFSGTICGGISWEAQDGTIVETTSNSVKIQWKNVINNNGSWKVRANYTNVKIDGSCGSGTFLDKPVAVKATTSLNITGDQVIPCGFRGTKTYTAQAVNSNYPANSYRWITSTGLSGTSTTGTINLTISNDDAGWIEVSGYNSTCQTYGPVKRINITRNAPSLTIDGPTNYCTSASYSVNNIPSGSTITWSISNFGSIVGPSNQSTVNITRGTGSIGFLKAVITGPCIGTVTLNKEITAGLAQPGQITIETGPNWGIGRISARVNPVPNADNYRWYLDGVLVRTSAPYQTTFFVDDCGVQHTIEVEAVNSCGTSQKRSATAISWCN